MLSHYLAKCSGSRNCHVQETDEKAAYLCSSRCLPVWHHFRTCRWCNDRPDIYDHSLYHQPDARPITSTQTLLSFFLLFAIVTTFEILFVFVHVCLSKRSSSRLMWKVNGATENARHENTGRSKMQGWKIRDMKMRDQFARVENAGKVSMESKVWKRVSK